MALAQFLSAVRVLIMDTEDLPSGSCERRLRYSELFPDLDAEELDDLSSVPPEKLRLYTSTIFHGERGMISNHFPCSLALMKDKWEQEFGEPLKLFSFIKEMHRSFPWKSNRTFDFARNFIDYVCSSELSAVVKAAPALPDMTRLENLALHIKRHPQEVLSARNSLSRDEIAALSVEGVLGLQCVVPESVRFLQCHFNVTEARQYFHTHSRALPESIKEQRVNAVGGRNRALYPRFTNLSDGEYAVLSEMKEGVTSFETFAANLLEHKPELSGEEQQFGYVLQLALNLSDYGTLVLTEE